MSKKIVTLERLEEMAVQSGFESGEILNDFNDRWGTSVTKKQCLTKNEIQSALGNKIQTINTGDINSNRLVREELIVFNGFETCTASIILSKGGVNPIPSKSFRLSFYGDNKYWATGTRLSTIEFPSSDLSSGTWRGTHEIKVPTSIFNATDYPVYFSLKYDGGYYTQLSTLSDGDGNIEYQYGDNDDSGFANFVDTDKDGVISGNDEAITVGRGRITWPLHTISIYAETVGKNVTPPTGETPHNIIINVKMNNAYSSSVYIDNAEIHVVMKYKDGTIITGGDFYMPTAAPQSVVETTKTLTVYGSKIEDCYIEISSDESYTMECVCGSAKSSNESSVRLNNIYLEDGLNLEVKIR